MGKKITRATVRFPSRQCGQKGSRGGCVLRMDEAGTTDSEAR